MIFTKYGNATLDSEGHYRITSSKEGKHNKMLHRVIYEDYHKCTILPFVDCHHKNGIKTDNRIENLELMYHGEHSRHHNTGDGNPKARLGVKVSKETRKKISKANKGKNLKPEPHIVKGGFTSAGNRMYRLVVNSKVVMYSNDKHKLEQMIEDGSYRNYKKINKYDIDMDLLKKEYDSGKTMKELGKMFGCSRKTISRRLSKIYTEDEMLEHRSKALTSSLTGKYFVDLPPREELRELRKTHTMKELVSMFNCSDGTIRRQLNNKR